MKRFFKLLTLTALLGIASTALFSLNAEAQLPQYFQDFYGNDFTVLNDSTADSTFAIGGNADVDTSTVFTMPYRWTSVTIEGLSNSAHADSAGVTMYLMGSLRGVAYTQIDSLLITVDNTPTFKAIDLTGKRYKFLRVDVHGIASTGAEAGANDPVAFLRIMYTGQR